MIIFIRELIYEIKFQLLFKLYDSQTNEVSLQGCDSKPVSR